MSVECFAAFLTLLDPNSSLELDRERRHLINMSSAV
jgi:hypothetical protein